MNTNAPEQLLSINDSSLNDWSSVFGGMVVLSNSTPFPQFQPLTYSLLTINPADPTAGQLATAINAMRMQFQNADGSIGTFENIGDILSIPQLTEQSPFLNTNNTNLGGQQLEYGISDEAYEAIPAQLLPLLRPDSIGKLTQINGGWNIQFSGSDGFDLCTAIFNGFNQLEFHQHQSTRARPFQRAHSARVKLTRTILPDIIASIIHPAEKAALVQTVRISFSLCAR